MQRESQDSIRLIWPFRLMLSILGVVILSLQLRAIISPHRLPRPGFYWPLIDYPMFSTAVDRGALVPRKSVYLTRANGVRAALSASDLGLNSYKFNVLFIAAVREGRIDEVMKFLEVLDQEKNNPIAKVEVEDEPLVIEKLGVHVGPRTTLAELNIGERSGHR